MPTYLIERRFAEEIDQVDAQALREINDGEGVRWLYSFLSKDKRWTHCLYEADAADAIRAAAQRTGLPADVIVEVGHTIHPDGTLAETR